MLVDVSDKLHLPMILITLISSIACLLILDSESQLSSHGVLACRGTGCLEVSTLLPYRGTGRLGSYRASERG